jgi:hypothetical protein
MVLRRERQIAFAFALAAIPVSHASSQSAAPLDWSADDSARIAWLERFGRTVRGRHAIVVAPADSLDETRHRALTDSLDRGITALRGLMGMPLAWQRIGDRPVTFYVSPGRFVSHASGRGAVFISLTRALSGTAPYLHEASHEFLEPPPPYWAWEYADTIVGNQVAARWPLWLSEGIPDYLAQTAAAAAGVQEGDVFSIGGLSKADSVCAARVAASPRREEMLRVLGATGRVEALFTTERPTVAPVFYACAQSMAKFLVERIGVKQAVSLFPAIKSGTWEADVGRLAGMPLAEVRGAWLERLRLR